MWCGNVLLTMPAAATIVPVLLASAYDMYRHYSGNLALKLRAFQPIARSTCNHHRFSIEALGGSYRGRGGGEKGRVDFF